MRTNSDGDDVCDGLDYAKEYTDKRVSELEEKIAKLAEQMAAMETRIEDAESNARWLERQINTIREYD